MKRRDRILKKYGGKEKKVNKPVETVQKKKEKQSFYEKNYKPLLIVPFLLLLFGIISIALTYANTGSVIYKGISLAGGVSVQIPTDSIESEQLQTELQNAFPDKEIFVRTLENRGSQVGLTTEASIQPDDEATLKAFIEKIEETTNIDSQEFGIQLIGSALGDAFFQQTLVAMILAFIFMGLVVFLYFKTFVPSIAVILAAASGIIVTVGILNIFEIKIGTAGIAALLMLIGYSVDTDILLTTRVLKNKEGTSFERTKNAMKTGLTMTITTLLAVAVTYFVAQSDVLREIMLIILIGLVVDLVFTWLQNAGILRWHVEKKENVKN